MFLSKRLFVGPHADSLQDPFFEMVLFVLISFISLQIALRVLNWTQSWF